VARSIIDEQGRWLRDFVGAESPYLKPKPHPRAYASSLIHFLNHERRMKEEAKAKRGTTRKKADLAASS
jgi:hypothetical protein